MDKEFLSVKETAVVFGVHENTIRKALKKGFLIGIRVGDGQKSPYRISRKEIEAIHSSIIRNLAEKAKNNVL
jgi:excisionase family DNA binding protein